MKLTLSKEPKERKEPKASKAPKPPKPPKERKPRKSGRGKGVGKTGKGQRFVLAIGDEGGILIFMEGRKVVRRLFAPSPSREHTGTLVELMQANPTVPISILADVLDQQYARHTFPPVAAMSVGGLVKRRLDRDFPAEDLKGSLSLGRDKTGRKEWNFLLISIANTPLLQQWLDLVVELPNELKGIFLVPVEGQEFIPRLRAAMPIASAPAPWQLYVTHNKISGFRQIVLKDGKLVFTRVTQAIDDGVAAVIAGNIEQEIINTLEYLRRLGFEENNTLEILVTAASEVKEALDLKRFNAAATNILTPLDAAELLGLEQAALSADRFGDVVMAASFGITKKRVLKFMTAYGKRLAQLYLLRRAVIAAGALVAAALVLASAINIVSGIGDLSSASDLESKRKPVERQMAEVQKNVDGLGHGVAYKSAIVSAYDAYMKGAQTPLGFVHELAPFLTNEIRADSFDWGPRESNPAETTNAPPANPDPDAPLQTEIRVDMEFTHTFQDVDELSKAVLDYLAQLKQKMPQYRIGTGILPWQSGGGGAQQSMEISFSQTGKDIREGMNKVTFYFWPIPPSAQGEGAAPAPAAPPSHPGGKR